MLRNVQRTAVRTLRHLEKNCVSRLIRANHYKVLEVPRNSSDNDIKHAYIKLSKIYHPDSNSPLRNAERFVQICAAYRALQKSTNRQAYDNRLQTHFENKEIYTNWVKYRAAMYHKQTGRRLKTDLQPIMQLRKCTALQCYNLRRQQQSNSSQARAAAPSLSYLCYLAGFGIVLGLSAYEQLKNTRRYKKSYY